LRKEANLEMEDRIELNLQTDSSALQPAIAAHKSYIMAETLTVRWSDKPLDEGAFKADVKVDGQPLHVELRKA
jgi:hypothetical protein